MSIPQLGEAREERMRPHQEVVSVQSRILLDPVARGVGVTSSHPFDPNKRTTA